MLCSNGLGLAWRGRFPGLAAAQRARPLRSPRSSSKTFFQLPRPLSIPKHLSAYCVGPSQSIHSSIACTHACQRGERLYNRHPFSPSKESAGLLSATEVILPAVSETWSIMGLELRFRPLPPIHQSRVKHAFVFLNAHQFLF